MRHGFRAERENMGQKRRGTDKVIHVVFGPGGGRVESKNQKPPADDANQLVPSLPDAREPITDVFSGTEVGRLLGLSAGKLRTLDRAGIVSPSGRRHGRRAYTFADLIALRTAQALLMRRVRLRDVARAVNALKRSLPKVTRPLAELRVVSDGQRLVVRSHEGSYEPLTGQMLLDLEIKSLRDDVVRVLRPAAGKERSKTAYSLYVRASQLDEDPATMKDAEALYRQALELDPWLAIAYTNLGNICFRKGEEADAEMLYRRALQIDARQPEAQYNLGYLMLERGRPVDAIPHFLGAIEADPKFADAYFNLAMAYEGIGDPVKARPCWKHYLELEPAGTWAEIARKHL
jgi:tetratricopeptide (TPR) repeat protein